MPSVRVDLGKRSYDIRIQEGLLGCLGDVLGDLGLGKKGVLITDPRVRSLFGKTVERSLKSSGKDITVLAVPEGERSKSMRVAEGLCAKMLKAGLDRGSFVIALGGGVIGDLAGFVAATFMRGIDYVQVPTTLLAQVDSSVGGKVAVNLSAGKNMVGCFYQPKAVLIDTAVLKSLPMRQKSAGAAEIIKYGVIRDAELFEYLEQHLEDMLAGDAKVLTHVIARCCAIKADVVAKDERESGLRAILNYGHTVGHAIEAVAGYRRFVHGEAISVGMLAAASLGSRMGICNGDCLSRQEALLLRAGLPLVARGVRPAAVMRAMQKDKKATGGVPRFVLPRRIGEVEISDRVKEKELTRVLQERVG